ncbi:MAG: hypothetical protein ACREUD_01360 [Gammaproteobacteria bacterium]
MDVEIGSRSETLDEGERAALGFGAFESRLLDQKCRYDAVDDASLPWMFYLPVAA